MNSLKYLFFIIGLFLLITCAESKREKQESETTSVTIDDKTRPGGTQKKVIVYGSMECNHCHEFRRKLESKGISYEFRDVAENDAYYLEMQKLILSINYQGYIRYPVLDIEGEIFVNPDFRDVENKMFSNIKK